MLFKKKQSTKENEKEKYLTTLLLKVIEEKTRLKKRVEKVIVCKGVIDLYPDGADQKAAIKDFEHSQQCLLNQIAFYDDSRQTFIKTLVKYQAEGVGLNWVKPLTSHEIVEETYKEFFGKR